MSRRDPLVAVQQMRDHGKEAMELAVGPATRGPRLGPDAGMGADPAVGGSGSGCSARSRRIRARYPHVPWQDTTDLRKVLIHKDDTVDFDGLW